MDFEVFDGQTYSKDVARRIADVLPEEGSVVLTGGTTAERLYPELAKCSGPWTRLEVLFSDERCVPPDDPASNFAMADRLLLERVSPKVVHRMKGEESPALAAEDYDREIRPIVEDGIDLLLLGMGADAHVGAMFPGSRALEEKTGLCLPVDRPDGMHGLTLTPPAMLSAKKILLLVTGAKKAETVERVLNGHEGIASCPARLLSDHPDATFLLDEAAGGKVG